MSCLDIGSSSRNIERHDEGLEYSFVNVFWDWAAVRELFFQAPFRLCERRVEQMVSIYEF